MIRFTPLQNQDTGTTVRGKLNTVIDQIINGVSGFIAVWRNLNTLAKLVSSNKEEGDSRYDLLLMRISQSQDYTDQKFTEVINLERPNKGYYNTEEALKDFWPTAPIGSQAYVGVAYPYAVWRYGATGWQATGETGGDETLALGEYLKYGSVTGHSNWIKIKTHGGAVRYPITKAGCVETESGRTIEQEITDVREGVAFINVNEVSGNSLAYASRDDARDDVPSGLRRSGLTICYLYGNRWVTERFNGADATEWGDSTKWKPANQETEVLTEEDYEALVDAGTVEEDVFYYITEE